MIAAVTWQLDYGAEAAAYQNSDDDIAEEERAELPPHLQPPELLPGASEVYAAFWELSTDRFIGMAAGPIPAAAIARWAQRHGYTVDEEIEFRRLIRAMDKVFCHRLSVKQSNPEFDISPRKLTPRLFDAMFS